MPDRLLLRLASDGSLTWLRQSAGARSPAASEAGTPPASVLADSGEIIVLVPTEDVLLTEVKLSARNRAQLLQALPYAVEEQLLGSTEEQHFAAAQGAGDTFGAAVVAKEKMRAWLARLAEAGIQPDVLMPESLALSLPASGANLMIEDARAIVRLSAWSAFACSLRELPQWLEQANADGAVAPLTVHDFRSAPVLALPLPIAAYRERQRDALAWLASGFTQAPLNLLDGEFATGHRHARGARWWRIAAMLAAAVVVLAIANVGFDVLRLSRASARMDTLAQDAVHAAFPDIDAAQLARLSPADLMRGRLERLRGGTESTGLLKVLAQIAPVLGGTTRIQTRGMEYRNGVLELALLAPDIGVLDSVRERLMTVPGVQAVVTAANPSGVGVDGRIRISNPADSKPGIGKSDESHAGTP
ncbi:MAG: type II secretion system protein GspL [Dokdonella sp.]